MKSIQSKKNNYVKHMNKKGFTLIEMLIALLICSFCTLLYTSFISVMKHQEYALYHSDDAIHLHQMLMLFALSKKNQLEGDMLAFRYLQKDMYYVFKDRKLILEDGYQVFLMEVDDVYFKKKEGCYYVVYTRTKQTSDRIIGCE